MDKMAMYDSSRVVENARKAEAIISCLCSFIETLTHQHRLRDDEMSKDVCEVILAIRTTAFIKGPDGEDYPDWDEKGHQASIDRILAKLNKRDDTKQVNQEEEKIPVVSILPRCNEKGGKHYWVSDGKLNTWCWVCAKKRETGDT